ncbi:hypothetical protein [Halomarina oriensis]|uniref:Competence protein CoiA n=1 Tax=Halomarina oriensis TaxID=671145 RepID=A0A6B0GFQ5_9EURY|nr:hypothetical protein [Halomarina oriensis]MWG33776.1 hypothetical protein [Halomarina oriensis]
MTVDADDDLWCPVCGDPLTVRRAYHRQETAVARHFVHLRETDCPGESDVHSRLKSLAADTLARRFTDATVTVEETIPVPRFRPTPDTEATGHTARTVHTADTEQTEPTGATEQTTLTASTGATSDTERTAAPVGTDRIRRADICVTFEEPHPEWGRGLVVEVQYRNHAKDIERVTRDFTAAEFSVLWVGPDDFDGTSLVIDEAQIHTVWPSAVPPVTAWSGTPAFVDDLREPPESVEVEVLFPAEVLKTIHSDWLWDQMETVELPYEWETVTNASIRGGTKRWQKDTRIHSWLYLKRESNGDLHLELWRKDTKEGESECVRSFVTEEDLDRLVAIDKAAMQYTYEDRVGHDDIVYPDEWTVLEDVQFDSAEDHRARVRLYEPPDGGLAIKMERVDQQDGHSELIVKARHETPFKWLRNDYHRIRREEAEE